jgi:hypothetical protein
MHKLGLLAGCVAIALSTGVAPSWAATWFVDAASGNDNGGTCGGAAIGSANPPCATLNQALQNANVSDVITVTHGTTFGPIFLTGQISISGPDDNSLVVANNGTAPGCIHATPGTCASASATNAGIEIAAGATDSIKLKGFLVNSGGSGTSSLHIQSAFVVQLTGMVFRSNNGSSLNAMVYDQSSLPTSGSPHQLYLHNCDVAFSNNGGDVWVAPSVPTSVHFSNGELHHAKFGYRADSTGMSTGTLNTVVDNTEFFSFNTNAVTVVGGASAFSVVSLSRSTISQAGNSGLVVSGTTAQAILYEDVITQTGTGVNILGGGTVFSLGNNEIFHNGTNIAGGSLTTNPPSLQ